MVAVTPREPTTRLEQIKLAQSLGDPKPGIFDFSHIKMPDPRKVKADFDIDELLSIYDDLDPEEQAQFDLLLTEGTGPEAALMPHQIVPWHLDWWDTFCLRGGRGVGKTLTGAEAVMELIEGQLSVLGKNKAHHIRIGIAAPTNVDARDTQMDGETGLMTLFGSEFPKYNKTIGQTQAIHKSGAIVRAMGTERESAWNGPQWSGLWVDELPLCNPVAIRDANLALRLGPKTGPFRARTIVTFTPKDIAWVNEFLARDDVYVPMYVDADTGKLRFPTTYDNPHLPEHRLRKFRSTYEGTRLGLRELHGIEIAGVEGAMWYSHDLFRYQPDPDKWPDHWTVVVAIDPAGSAPRKKADENAVSQYDREQEITRRAKTAICVCALASDGRIYVLFWIAGRWSPNTWARKAVMLYHLSGANRFVAERNFGGDMVESTLRNVWRDAPVEVVVASKGKDQRAEPVVALYEQGNVIHTAVFADAEAQCEAFISAEKNEGADYVDSLVWGVHSLMGWSVLDQRRRGPIEVVGEVKELASFVIR